MLVKRLKFEELEYISYILTSFFYKTNTNRFKIFNENIDYIKKYTGKEIDKITNLSNSLKFTLLMMWIDKINISKLKISNNLNFDKINENAIFITPHSPYNVLAIYLMYKNRLFNSFYNKPVILILEKFKKEKHEFLYFLMKNFESLEKNMDTLLVESNTTKKCLKILLEGKNLLFFCDRNVGKGKRKIKFMGKDIYSPWYSISKLHTITKKPLVAFFGKNTKINNEIEINYEILNADSIDEMEQKICKTFEKNILNNLNTWNITSRVWVKESK